jgi:ATP-dependent helicase HrpB
MIESVVFDVKKALSENVPVLVTADPGSGKTTILPPLLLKEPWLAGRTIVLLEPRRLAAKSAASRMASLHGERPGETFGWKIAH